MFLANTEIGDGELNVSIEEMQRKAEEARRLAEKAEEALVEAMRDSFEEKIPQAFSLIEQYWAKDVGRDLVRQHLQSLKVIVGDRLNSAAKKNKFDRKVGRKSAPGDLGYFVFDPEAAATALDVIKKSGAKSFTKKQLARDCGLVKGQKVFENSWKSFLEAHKGKFEADGDGAGRKFIFV